MSRKKLFYGTLLGALGLGILSAISAYILAEPLIWQILVGLSGLSLIAHLVLHVDFYKGLFGQRTTQLGLRTVLNALLVFAIVVVINLIVSNHDLKKDVTRNKVHTLSDQSIKLMKGLTTEVTFKAFVNPQQVGDFENIFSKYSYYTKKLKKEFIDVDKDPLLVKQYNIRAAGTVIVESGDRTARVENLMGPDDPKIEEKLTNAIISVTKGGKKKLYYISGHGERLLSDTARDGFSTMKEVLESSRYEVEDLLLVDKSEVPTDAELVMIAGPKSEFLPKEYQALNQYIRQGGKILVLLEPNSPSSLREFLGGYGVDWKSKRVVVENNTLQQFAGGNPLTPIIASFDATHEITRDAKQIAIFPISTPVEKAKSIPEGETVTVLFSTSAKSLESELQGDKVKINQATDRKGPLSLALAISGPIKNGAPKTEGATEAEKMKEFRMVVVGDSDFASNTNRQFGMNADLFQNMLSWLAQEEDLIAIRPRSAAETQFDITEQRSRVIILASIFIAPLVMFVSGVSVWISRRRR